MNIVQHVRDMYTTDEAQIGKITRIEKLHVSTIAEEGKETIWSVCLCISSLFLFTTD